MRVYAHLLFYIFVGATAFTEYGLDLGGILRHTHGFLYLGFRGRTQIKWMTSSSLTPG